MRRSSDPSRKGSIRGIALVAAIVLVGLGLYWMVRDAERRDPGGPAVDVRASAPRGEAPRTEQRGSREAEARVSVAPAEESVELRLRRIDAALTDWAETHDGFYPSSLHALTVPDSGGRVRLHPTDLVDPWGNAFVYSAPGHRAPMQLLSLGRDGRPGGEGEDADRTLDSSPP